jgi:hypothetical protein
MNPFDLTTTELFVWGFVGHTVADLLFQPERMSREKKDPRKAAGYAHGLIHALMLVPVFGLVAFAIGAVHTYIDTFDGAGRWKRFMEQGDGVEGLTDYALHVATIAVAALIVGGVS